MDTIVNSPPGNILFSVNLHARSGFQSPSLPWEMSYKKQQRKAREEIYSILEQENIG